MRKVRPQLLIGHGRFRTLLGHSDFITYCRKRDVHIDEWKLEFLEAQDLLYPALRLHRPAYKIKVDENPEKNTYRELGVLEESETWKGPTRTEFSVLYLSHSPSVNEWVKEKLIYTPDRKKFRPWKDYGGKEERVEHLYSVFQLFPLFNLIDSFRFPYSSIDLIRMSERKATRYFREHLRHVKSTIDAKCGRRSNFLATVAQVLSSRYLPFASQYGPLVTTSTEVNPFDKKREFNIFEYRRGWNAEKTRKSLDMTLKEIRDGWKNLIFETDDSPISNWRELVDLVNPEKKKFLKGSALRYEDFYRVARMLDLFYFDLTEEHLYMSEEVPNPEEIKGWYGVDSDDFQYKEFVVNSYGLNPRPSLILMVEGPSEYQEIPELMKWFLGHSLTVYQIQIKNLKGIGEFTTNRIERFIDHNHSLQTIVYFVLDKENNSDVRVNYLTSHESKELPGFTISKPEFFTVWERNIEFDNFTDIEIAASMTKISEQRFQFSEAEISALRENFHATTGTDPIGSLYKNRVNYGLSKPKLLSQLFEVIRSKPTLEVDGKPELRPILKTIRKVSQLALKNYRPSKFSKWAQAQEEGWIRNVYQGNTKKNE